ncbi:cation-transporting P-type ATPase [Clostridium sp.]|jgi:magnesium-transporting ATPase (P-type)|uniref:P-type ATPase n=1 Tax=Clostridium sp. TaxID=1506 RepID=UPI0025857EF6|nr:cation-transporting P-type ATPase [Clostridium sp.]MDF2502865.1 calcium-transporting ATPase 1 [Clostridium sp.]
MTDWYNLSWNDVVNLFQSNTNRGLDQNKVLINRETFGTNLIEDTEKKLFVKSILKEILRPWIFSLLASAILYFFIGSFISGMIILVIASINLCIIIRENYRDQKKFILLDKVNSGMSTIIRNGNLLNIKNEEIVVGDIVVYKKGSIIPADMRITNCDNLTVTEESVTGDSNIIEKYSAKIVQNDLELAEMRNILFKSSVIKSGNGEGIVVAVGQNTEIGRFVKSLLNTEKSKNSFYKRIYNVLDKLAIVGFLGVIIGFIIKISSGSSNQNIIFTLAAILTTEFPIGLISIIYLINLIIKKNMAKNNIFINNVSKIQDISNTSILFTKKEEIFTQKLMSVKNIYDTKKIQDIEKSFIINDNTKRIMETGILCNDSKLTDNNNEKDNLVEEAFVSFGDRYSMNKSTMDRTQKRIFKLPYDREYAIKTTVNKIDRKYRAYVKGTVEVLIDRCTHIMKNGIERELTKDDIEDIKNADINMSNQCLYVLGFAYRNFNYKPRKNENIESNLIFSGLVGFDTPLKEGVNEDIERCRRMSIKPVIFIEDSKLTAGAFGKKIGVINSVDMIISDLEMDYMDNSEVEKTIEKVSVFSRIQPYNKLKIISKYKDSNYNIISIGNNIIDLPSLLKSGLYISFGNNCNRVVKELSDVYVEKIDFSSILNLIEESKHLIYTLREIVKFLLIFSLGEFIACILSVGFNLYIPFYFKHIFWNYIFNGFLFSLAIFLSRKQGKIYEDRGNIINDNVFKYFKKYILLDSILLGSITFLGLYIAHTNKSSSYETIALSILYFSQIILLIKKETLKNVYFVTILILYFIFNSAALYTSIGQKLMGLKKINANDIKTIVVLIGVYIVMTILKKIFEEKNSYELEEMDKF